MIGFNGGHVVEGLLFLDDAGPRNSMTKCDSGDSMADFDLSLAPPPSVVVMRRVSIREKKLVSCCKRGDEVI